MIGLEDVKRCHSVLSLPRRVQETPGTSRRGRFRKVGGLKDILNFFLLGLKRWGMLTDRYFAGLRWGYEAGGDECQDSEACGDHTLRLLVQPHTW